LCVFLSQSLKRFYLIRTKDESLDFSANLSLRFVFEVNMIPNDSVVFNTNEIITYKTNSWLKIH
jgi:hypothetical protein